MRSYIDDLVYDPVRLGGGEPERVGQEIDRLMTEAERKPTRRRSIFIDYRHLKVQRYIEGERRKKKGSVRMQMTSWRLGAIPNNPFMSCR